MGGHGEIIHTLPLHVVKPSPEVLSMQPWKNISRIQVLFLFLFFSNITQKAKTGTANR
jgi:hypothetical protein